MPKELEIEKKYIVKRLPDGLLDCPHIEIEQSYLNRGGSAIRLRKFVSESGTKTLLSKKVRLPDAISAIEYNIDLDNGTYEALKEAREGRILEKTRYIYPLGDGLTAEINLFHGFFEGVCFAEIEFPSAKQAKSYSPPDWLEEAENTRPIINEYMATAAKSIEEYKDFMPII